MLLSEFLKKLFEQQSIEGYEIGEVEVYVNTVNNDIYVTDDSYVGSIKIVPHKP
jgi:hypothetical protein